MRRTILALALAVAAPAAAVARAGDAPAGGAFMSSYISDPYTNRGSAAANRGGVGLFDVPATGSTGPQRSETPVRPRRR